LCVEILSDWNGSWQHRMLWGDLVCTKRIQTHVCLHEICYVICESETSGTFCVRIVGNPTRCSLVTSLSNPAARIPIGAHSAYIRLRAVQRVPGNLVRRRQTRKCEGSYMTSLSSTDLSSIGMIWPFPGSVVHAYSIIAISMKSKSFATCFPTQTRLTPNRKRSDRPSSLVSGGRGRPPLWHLKTFARLKCAASTP